MGKSYQNKLFIFLSSIRKDLMEGKIDQEQFDFLMGVFMKKELNTLIEKEIKELTNIEEKSDKQIALISYKRNRVLSHVF